MAYCKACGKAVSADSAFCSSCGAALSQEDAPVAWGAAVEPSQPAVAPGPFNAPPPPPFPTGPAPGYPTGAPAGTNGMAIAALVCSIALVWICGLGAILGIVFGNIAQKQIRQTGEQGAGMAKAGIIIGWIFLGLWVAYLVFVLIAVASSSGNRY
jgi:hypothetical protein